MATAPASGNRARLADWHRQQQARLQDLVALELRRLLGEQPDFTEASIDRYVAAALPVVRAGQLEAAETGARYAAALARRIVTRFDGALDDTELAGPGHPALLAPPLTARRILAETGDHDQAIDEAAMEARTESSNLLRTAAVVGLAVGVTAYRLRTTGYTKVVGPDACELCQSQADDVYPTADDVPMHRGDSCSVAPVTE